MRFLIAIICCLVFFVDLPTVSAKTCGKDEYKVKLEVRTRFRQKSVVKAYTYTEKIRSSKTFKKLLEKMSTEASISGSYGAFSASASAAYSSLTDSVQSNENNAKDVKIDETTFNKDFLQIFQEVVTKVSIDGKTATKTKTEFVNSVPVSEPWSSKRLRDEASAYMEYEFPEGAKRNTFTETVCRKREVKACHQMNVDFGGNDLAQVHNVPSWQQCSAICAKRTTCQVWTWTDDTYHKSSMRHWCFLKWGNPSSSGLGGAISGSKGCK